MRIRVNSFVVSGLIHVVLISALFVEFKPQVKEEKKVPEWTNLVLMESDIPISKLTSGKLESQQKEGGLHEGKGKAKEKKEDEGIKQKHSPTEDTGIRQGLNKPIISDEEAIKGFRELAVLFFLRKGQKLLREWVDERGIIHRELFDYDYRKYVGTIWVKAVFSEDGLIIPDSIQVVQKSENMSEEAVQYWINHIKKLDMAARYRRKFTVIFPICIRAVLDDKIIDGKVLDLYPKQCENLNLKNLEEGGR
uniref:Uncharacterized protein n=1 Tax=Thermocrinis ruber TaxID=75906 RepID=A0A7C5X412_9AQUI